MPSNTVADASVTGQVRSDFNGDGYDDLAVGVPSEDVGSIVDAGAVNVLYGSKSGLQTTSPSDQFWMQDTAGVEETAESGDIFGSSLAAGDFNGDGYYDLAIGVPGEDVGSVFGAGGVNVLYGSNSGLRVDAAGDGTGRQDQFWSQDSPGVEDQAGPQGENFGLSLASGDFNNDGKDDLAIGAPFELLAGREGNNGAVNVHGSSSGLQTSSPADQFWSQDSPNVEDTAEDDEFGNALAGADFNGDGYDDLAIAAFAEAFGDIPQAGAVNVLYGSSSGLQATSPADQFWNQDSPGVKDLRSFLPRSLLFS